MNHRKPNNTRKNKIYGNWLVLHPDGFEMFRCTTKKADWYLDRGLAEVITKTPPVMKLNFEPNGPGWRGDAFSLHQKKNECVVCGSTDLEKLTRHHIVPTMYKKFFPKELKTASSHDVVSICRKDHDDYEINYALNLKKEIEEKYGIPINDDKNAGLSKAIKLSKAYVFNHDKIPRDRLDELLLDISIALNKDELVDIHELIEMSQLTYEDYYRENSHGRLVVEQINDFQGFVEMWRQHFLDCMNPKFMPNLWSVKRPLKKDLTHYESVT